MNLLLDTHAFIWFASDDPRLPASIRSQIIDPDVDTAVSIASIWEIGIKVSAGRWAHTRNVLGMRELALAQNIEILPITVEAIHHTADMDWFNKDPFDRIIAATAITQGLCLATIEKPFEQWGVVRAWG
jgi:PIN domain nuclease of toxin-antitoxin system